MPAQSTLRPRSRLRAGLALAPVIAAVALAGCGGSSSSSKSSGAATPVAIQNFNYGPATVTVKPGATINFTNRDSTPHTATADNQSFDTGSLSQGQSKSIAPGQPGTYAYHCVFHAFMKGRIVVAK